MESPTSYAATRREMWYASCIDAEHQRTDAEHQRKVAATQRVAGLETCNRLNRG